MAQVDRCRPRGIMRGLARTSTAFAAGATCFLFTSLAEARDRDPIPNFNLYGLTGLIDMPTAEVPSDGTLSLTYSSFGDNARGTLSFQITPRLSGSFRYAGISNFVHPASVDGIYYDRSFDLRYQLIKESRYLPSVVVGLQDFIGTGLYGGEYVVATKELFPGLKVTGGLGWGRLGSRKPIGSIGVRPTEILGEGGIPTYDRWFRGDFSAFGGLSYQVNDRLQFQVEYSSDNYDLETTSGAFDHGSPFNFGASYFFKNGTQVSLYHAYGNEIGAQVTIHTNPRTAQIPGGNEEAPVPIKLRNPQGAYDLGWTKNATVIASAEANLTAALERDGLRLEGLELGATKASVRVRNERYGIFSQAIGRTVRAMTRALPDSVETFVIIPVSNGAAAAAFEFSRSDIEALEHKAAVEILEKAQITDAFGKTPRPNSAAFPDFKWSLAPYIDTSFFDPNQPVRADLSLRLKADYWLTSNLALSGSMTKRIGGNLTGITREDPTGLPAVRTDYGKFINEGDPAIEHLTLAHYGRLSKDLYSRVTVGYLEQMYAGVSAEVLWKPVTSRLALGAEVNYVQRRDFDQMFGIQGNTTRTGIIPDFNGHISAYYDFGRGFHGQLDVGRYLAGDLGATISVDREFANGWTVGAYATFTDTPFEAFGEGSFDKGIRISIPIGAALNTPNTDDTELTIRSLTRDGGARLVVNHRLYEHLRGYHKPEIAKSWGKFWR